MKVFKAATYAAVGVTVLVSPFSMAASIKPDHQATPGAHTTSTHAYASAVKAPTTARHTSKRAPTRHDATRRHIAVHRVVQTAPPTSVARVVHTTVAHHAAAVTHHASTTRKPIHHQATPPPVAPKPPPQPVTSSGGFSGPTTVRLSGSTCSRAGGGSWNITWTWVVSGGRYSNLGNTQNLHYGDEVTDGQSRTITFTTSVSGWGGSQTSPPHSATAYYEQIIAPIGQENDTSTWQQRQQTRDDTAVSCH